MSLLAKTIIDKGLILSLKKFIKLNKLDHLDIEKIGGSSNNVLSFIKYLNKIKIKVTYRDSFYYQMIKRTYFDVLFYILKTFSSNSNICLKLSKRLIGCRCINKHTYLKKFKDVIVLNQNTKIKLIRFIKSTNDKHLLRIYYDRIKDCEQVFIFYDKKMLKLNFDRNKIMYYAFEEKNKELFKDLIKFIDDDTIIELLYKYISKISFDKQIFIDFLDIWISKKYKNFDNDMWDYIICFCNDKYIFNYLYNKILTTNIKYDLSSSLMKYSKQHFDVGKISFLEKYI